MDKMESMWKEEKQEKTKDLMAGLNQKYFFGI